MVAIGRIGPDITTAVLLIQQLFKKAAFETLVDRDSYKAVRILNAGIKQGRKAKTDKDTINEIIAAQMAIEEEDAKKAGAVGYMARAMVMASMPHSHQGEWLKLSQRIAYAWDA
ncbi:MAG: hypothetical protein AB2660_18520 [Candidatus Thiodiazotropha sp.]